MKLFYFLALTYILITCQSVFGQVKLDTVKISSLNAVIAQAIKNNPTQAIFVQHLKQAAYNYQASKGFLYPNASGSFNGTDNIHLGVTPIPGILIGKPGTTYYAQFGKQYTYNTGITLTQDIFDWTSVFQAQIADNAVKLNQVQQDSSIQLLKDKVAKVYFSALVAKSALKINYTDRALADSLEAITHQRFNEGTTDAISLNQAAINTNSILQNEAQSQQLYDQSIENLKILLGTTPASELKLSETINLDSLNETQIGQMGDDKALSVYKQQINIADLQSRSQRSAAYPKLSATAYLGAQQFRTDFGLAFTNTAWTPYRYIGINLNVPIFTGFTNTNKYKSSLIQKNIAELQYSSARDQSEINDRLLLKNYSDYLKMVNASESSFKLYGKNLRLNQQKYQEGVIGMDVYLKAFQDYLTAENTYLNNLSQLLSIRSTILSRIN